MKTVRHNVFETNSSSTHSVTITTKSAPKPGKTPRELVVDGTLYPMRLSDYSTSFGYDGSNLNCDTKDKKAAIVANWILSCKEYGNIEDTDFKVYIRFLREKCGYLTIDFEGDSYSSYNPYDENDGSQFSLSGDEDEDYAVLEEALKNILDDDIVIVDTDSPY